jgi:hypothetical protein
MTAEETEITDGQFTRNPIKRFDKEGFVAPEDKKTVTRKVKKKAPTKAKDTRVGKIKVERNPDDPRQYTVHGQSKPHVVEGNVTMAQLAKERGIQSQLARLWLLKAGFKKPGTRWMWKDDSRDLARVRKALGL